MLYLIALLAIYSDTSYLPDELAVGRLMSFAGTSNHAVVFYLGRKPSLNIAIFDLEKGVAQKVDDGRIRVMHGLCLAFPDHFVLVDHISKLAPKAHILSLEGAFQETLRLNEFKGWSGIYYDMGFDGNGKPVLLYFDPEHPTEMYGAEIDFKNRTLTQKYQQTYRSETELLSFFQGHWILVNKQTAKTVLSGDEKKLLFPEHDLVLNTTKTPPGLKLPGKTSPYKNRVVATHPQPNLLQMEYFDMDQEETDDPSDRQKTFLFRSADSLDVDTSLLIHSNKGKTLRYSYKERSFYME